MDRADKQSQDTFRLLVETAGCMVLILRDNYSIVYFNSFAENLTGYSVEEVRGQDYCTVFLPSDERAGFAAEIERVLAGGAASQAYECVVRCRDGSLRWLEWNAQRLDNFEGQPGLLAVGHDITQRKQATEELHDQEARLRAVLDTAVDGIITIDDHGIVQSVNSAAETIFGYTSNEMIGCNVSMLMPLPYCEDHDKYLANYIRTCEKRIIGTGRQAEGKRKDGTTFPCDLAVSEVPMPGQRLFTGILRDITDRKRAEQELRESKERFDLAIRATADGIWDWPDVNEQEEWWSPRFYELLGYSPGEIASNLSTFNDLIHPDDKPATNAAVGAHFEDNVRFDVEYRLRTKSGVYRWFRARADMLRDKNGQPRRMTGCIEDIHDRRVLESERKLAEERALQAERLAAIGETVAGLAHESRNAFQRSRACLEMLELELEDRPNELELVDRTQRALDHLHKLYEEVRNYAAPITLDRQSCDVAHLWRDAWSHLEVNRRQKTVVFREIGDEISLSCDADWFAMGQVFRNIFENAITACGDPGVIEIRWRESETDGKLNLEIAIRDNGPGIAPVDRDRVFNAFFTTKTKGTGLGMAIASRIVEAHGGRIAIGDSDRGAEFVITLPRS